jgi:hypothetical protein
MPEDNTAAALAKSKEIPDSLRRRRRPKCDRSRGNSDAPGPLLGGGMVGYHSAYSALLVYGVPSCYSSSRNDVNVYRRYPCFGRDHLRYASLVLSQASEEPLSGQ